MKIKPTSYCNICGRLPHETKTKRLVRDHNHDFGHIRGLLCDFCNAQVGIYESKMPGAKRVIEARKQNSYITWKVTYLERIRLHLLSNTGKMYNCKGKYNPLNRYNILPND